jgi:murein DD-endopeptidase MepM/ murein hydrolase activator NlpD
MMHHRTIRSVALCVTLAVLFSCAPLFVRAASLEDLRAKIDEKTEQIDALQKEIKQYESKLQETGAARQTLETAIAQLNLTRQKLLADISLTQKQIEQTNYSIEQLDGSIHDQEQRIALNDNALGAALGAVRQSDNQTLVELVLGNDSLGDVWAHLGELDQIQTNVQEDLSAVRTLKDQLSSQRDQKQQQNTQLSAYKNKLSGQKQVVDVNKQQKDQLLAQTKNQESTYQQLIAQKKKAAQEFESELQDYEAQLQYIQDPNSLPQKGSAVLGWPVEHPVVTQGFGLTSFAKSGAYGYDKSGQPNPHRGIDFHAVVGTPVLAAADGVVRDSVNMDAQKGCYSYGQWILIDHQSGISTLYAHLSVRSVSPGQQVKEGQIIGYAGQSGYALGAHLHFTVFDERAAKVSPFSWSVGCKNVKVPYAPYDAYLNPLDYLPKL